MFPWQPCYAQDLPYSEIKHSDLHPSSKPTRHCTMLWICTGLVALNCSEESGQQIDYKSIMNNFELIKCLLHFCHNAESVDRCAQLSVDVPDQV